jgi:hypothetical protein
MHTREFFYDNYKNHPEPTLKRIAGEYSKLTPEAQEALRDVLRERKLESLISEVAIQEEKKNSLAHLSADEVRVLINSRLEQGENLEIIKMDLRQRGVNIYKMSLEESRSEENIDRRFMELQAEGKTKEQIDRKLKEEFRLSDEQATKVPERMRSNGSGMLGAGLLMLIIFVPWFLVIIQTPGRHQVGYIAVGVGAGLGFLIMGIRKRMVAAKFIKEAEKKQ